jgi:DNA-binding beta-propeller fold protein YncE
MMDSTPIIPNLTPSPQLTVSTVPANGDVNPYGVAFVPRGFAEGGPLHAGDILVSNFNNSDNSQGTGTTIVQITPAGTQSVFFQGPPHPTGQNGLGLTTALGVLKRGFVIVGNVPTLDGTSGTVQAPGSLLIIDRFGNVVNTLTDSTLLDGPWDLTIHDQGEKAQVFVSNVLSGTVTRIDLEIPRNGNPVVESETQIGSGYLAHTDPAALLVGPTGLAYDADHNVLYVASTGDNEIFAISRAKNRTTDAGMGTLVYQDNVHLHGPLGLVLAPNGDLIASQGDAVNSDSTQPSELVEFTPTGQFVAQMPVDSSGMQGGAFGIALQSSGDQITFAAVDDISNTLEVWTIKTDHKRS